MTTTNQTERIAVQFCSPLAGDLYRVQGEDDYLYCYDWTFRVTTRDGRTFELSSHAVRGAVRNHEGFMVANRRARSEAEAFAQRVEARGSIDPAHWTEVTVRPYDLQSAWAADAAREDLERRGLVAEVV